MEMGVVSPLCQLLLSGCSSPFPGAQEMVEMLKGPSWPHPACTGRAQNSGRAPQKGTRQGYSSKELVESVKEEVEMLP